MLWEVDIYAAEGQPDIGASEVAAAAAELHLLDCGAGVPPAVAAGTTATTSAAGTAVATIAGETPAPQGLAVTSARGYLIEGDFDRGQVMRIADELLADRVVERTVAAPVGDAMLKQLPAGRTHWIHVMPKPGVMDPVAQAR